MNKNISWQNIKNSVIFHLKNYWWKFLIIAFVLSLDLVTKSVLVNQNQELWQNYVLIDGVLVIMPTKNLGAGFSLLYGKTWLLITLTIVFVAIFTIFNVMYKKKSKLYGVASALILTGAIGNLVDRLAFGYVRDFIYLQFINFPVFNVADMSLTFGVILLIIYMLFYSTKKQKVDINNSNINCEKQTNGSTGDVNIQNNETILQESENNIKIDNKNKDGVNDAKDSDR